MRNLIALIQAHPTVVTMGAYYVLSAAIGSLPMPDSNSHVFYRWFFGFANTIAANVTRAFASKLPQPPAPPAAGGK